jgi:DNA-binding GntR family transcriptional regulator
MTRAPGRRATTAPTPASSRCCDRIKANYYTPGKRIPSIAELGIETGLSRQTVGRALRFLESEGLAVRAAGLGYFVTDPDD